MRTLVALGAVLSLGACSEALVPVADPDHRFPCKGFTVLPPHGKGWFTVREADEIEREVLFLKRGPAPGHTVMACAFPLPGRYDDVDSVLEHLRGRGGHAGHDGRLANRTEEGSVVESGGLRVVVCLQRGEEQARAGGVAVAVTIETRSWTFLDVATKKAAQLWVSERRPHGVAPLPIDGEVAAFVQGFRFGSPVN